MDSQRRSEPLLWYPKGVTDTLDATETPAGSMQNLSNLVPDPSTPNLWQCRPASFKLTSFSGFTTPGFISALLVAGNFAYGMIATGRNAGHDEPFVYNIVTNTFVTVTGTITMATTPASPATSGAWVPPIMDIIGSKVVVTHQGFAAGTNFIGWIDISTPATPVWNAGNLSGAITFSTVPTFVAQFANRAYYIVNATQPALVFSDVLNATNVTNGTQSLTFDDVVPLTALGQLRLYNQLGGIIQALIVFKGTQNCYQITGDAATSNLARNALNVATGTSAPLALAPTKAGLAFISPEGLRIIDFTGTVSDPLGRYGKGVSLPFIYSNVPSRMTMKATGDTVRISTQNANAFGTPQQEWWYHMTKEAWSGPHTFPCSQIEAFGSTFIIAPIGVTGSLWQSDAVQSAASTFTENNVALTYLYQTAFLPNLRKMSNYAVSFSTLDIALAPGTSVSVTGIVPGNKALDVTQISVSGTSTIWGSFTWGGALWGGVQTQLLPRIIAWHFPLVFAKFAIEVTGPSNNLTQIGCLALRYKMLRYLEDITALSA